MISHKHRSIFTHIPKTAGKSILALFDLPEFGRDYIRQFAYIEDPYDHHQLLDYQNRQYFYAYFKFAFTRNPWDRLVSTFFYLNGGGCNQWDEMFRQRYLKKYRGDFHYFLRELDDFLYTKYFLPQYLWICDEDGNLLTDFLGRFETLKTDLAVVGEKIKLDSTALPHRNRCDHSHYMEYYDSKARQIVAQKYAKDITYLGYHFVP